MPFLWGLIYFLRTTCYHGFNVLKEMHWTKLILLHLHSWFICIHKSFDNLFSRNLLLFPLHAWTFLFRVIVLLLHWWISTTSKADLRMPRSWTWGVLDGWVLKMMGWRVTHNLHVEGFLSKECNTIAILTLPECPEHPILCGGKVLLGYVPSRYTRNFVVNHPYLFWECPTHS
jgi:hypothetical protein